MDAFKLAKKFQEFVAREWPGNAEEQGELLEFFGDWAQDPAAGNLVFETAGSYTMVLQTWIIVSAWFAQRPEDFAAIWDFVTVPINLPPGATSLPFPLDEGEWNKRVFRAKYG